MTLNRQKLRLLVREWEPSLERIESIEEIEGGNLNWVWRVCGSGSSCIVKQAPSHIATRPDVPLSQYRAVIEARALKSLNSGKLRQVLTDSVRVPEFRGFVDQRMVLIMEDVSHSGTLGDMIRRGEPVIPRLKELADFIARLHASTHDESWARTEFSNRPMQETRFEVQYKPIPDQLAEAGVEKAEEIGGKARELGEKLQQAGKCMIMGDLWPPGVLKTEEGLCVIDWELAHYGRPLQDIGHHAAHLWLYSRAYGQSPADLISPFLNQYRESLDDQFDVLWDQQERKGMAIHMASEIIIRTLGAFSADYLDGTFRQEPLRKEALEYAVGLLKEEEKDEFIQILNH